MDSMGNCNVFRRFAACLASSVLLSLSFTALVSVGASAAAEPAGHASDEASIRAQAKEYSRAFANAEVEKLAALWADKAIFVDQFGNVFRGQDEIKKEYEAFFYHNGGQALDIEIESISFPSDDTAIEEGVSSFKNSSSSDSRARYTATHIKLDGKWIMESVIESPYKAPNNGDYLKPLSWLLGRWKVECPRGVLNVSSAWVNSNVMALNVEATPKDKDMKTVQSEFIYWNPRSRCISSWQFDGSGGTSTKWWERSGDSWVVHAVSLQADGSRSRADYILKPINSDSFSWQSRHRSLDGVALPDTEQITVTRVKS